MTNHKENLRKALPESTDIDELYRKMCEARLFFTREIAALTSEELAEVLQIDSELAGAIHEWAVTEESNGTVKTGGGRFVTGGQKVVIRKVIVSG
jgi:hypothetical protein